MNPLISADELKEIGPMVKDLRILDARFRLGDPATAERLYLEGHIPGAIHVHPEVELTGEKGPLTGRHPFPSREALVALFSRLGIGPETTVVVYDDTDHAGAARCWFLLRWMGFANVRVLNGGLKAWGRPLDKGESPLAQAAVFSEGAPLVRVFGREELAAPIVDARAPERFRGEVEPIDPVAGHIPGAQNLFYRDLLGADGCFLPPEQLREKLLAVGAGPTFYCGSGITGCVPILAAASLGLEAALYPGSWSEWCRQPGAPVEKGCLRTETGGG